MFDLIVGATQRPLQERSPTSKALAVVLHVAVIGSLVAVALTQGTKVLPTTPTIMAFVAPRPDLAPPPPAPEPPKPARAIEPTKSVPAVEPSVPVDVQPEARPEPAGDRAVAGVEFGVAGGVEGGVAGGTIAGVVAGLVSEVPPLPPLPPAPTAPAGPVRIGGLIHEPTLMRRVEPVYPGAASVTQITGLVILEAVVDKTGCVESVKVLRSRHPLLDNAAIDALRQWQYAPLLLNDTPVSFVLTVTFNFSIQGQNRGH
jgi:protein TonB